MAIGISCRCDASWSGERILVTGVPRHWNVTTVYKRFYKRYNDLPVSAGKSYFCNKQRQTSDRNPHSFCHCYQFSNFFTIAAAQVNCYTWTLQKRCRSYEWLERIDKQYSTYFFIKIRQHMPKKKKKQFRVREIYESWKNCFLFGILASSTKL